MRNSRILILAGYWDGSISLVDIEQGKLMLNQVCHNSTITAMTIDEKEQFLVTGTVLGDVI